MKLKKHEQKVRPGDSDDTTQQAEEAVEKVTQNITCSYGIHRGNFPVAGMKVKEARAVLKKLIKVDPSAVAIINGQQVDEEETISAETTLLSFVKPSAVKGADIETITIEGSHASMVGKKLAVDKFCREVAKNTVSGLNEEPIPDNVKWIVRSGKLTTYIIELKPELRRINWSGEPQGQQGQYKYRKLATPYVILAVPFVNGQLHRFLELFYRTEPLRSLDDPLYYSNLLNVSMGRHVAGSCGLKTWVCTQYLNTHGLEAHADVLSEIISHIFGGGFNRSSDRNEGASGFSHYEQHSSDKRLNNADQWEKASEKDPRFVLDADWIKAGCTPRDLINFRMRQFNVVEFPTNAKALGNLLLASKLV